MGRLTNREINAIGAPNTTDRNVHARGASGRIRQRLCRGQAANAPTSAGAGHLLETDEILHVFNIERTATAPSAGSDAVADIAGEFEKIPLFLLQGFEITNDGSGYTSAPTVTITAPANSLLPGTTPTSQVTINSGAVTRVIVGTNAYYTTDENITATVSAPDAGNDRATVDVVMVRSGIVALRSGTNRNGRNLLVVSRIDP